MDNETKQQGRALRIGEIPGVLPFAGSRNPLTLSTSARRPSITIATPATKGMRRVYNFESDAECATALDIMRDPDVWDLEVQLPAIPYTCSLTNRRRRHSFDLRITFRDGFRRAVFVRNASSLAKSRTQQEVDDIFKALPASFADDAVVVNGDAYTRAYRDNLRRFHLVSCCHDPATDAHVRAVAEQASYWYLRDLIAQCDVAPDAAFQSALRLIACGTLSANMHAVINVHSRVEWAA